MKPETKLVLAICLGVIVGCIIGFGFTLPATAHAPQPATRFTYSKVSFGDNSTSMIVVYDRAEGKTCYIATKRYADGGVGIDCP